jgi:hypothetical protein
MTRGRLCGDVLNGELIVVRRMNESRTSTGGLSEEARLLRLRGGNKSESDLLRFWRQLAAMIIVAHERSPT